MNFSRSAFARALVLAGVVSLWLVAVMTTAPHGAPQTDRRADGWRVPETASEEENPLTITPQTLAAGRALFQKNCRRCHGPKGIGDGPDADPDHMADMDLTNPKRASENPDGVVFHKVWNGRSDPKMPAFKDELTREQVWAIVAYVQSLRTSPGA